jgi:hypothetical protein
MNNNLPNRTVINQNQQRQNRILPNVPGATRHPVGLLNQENLRQIPVARPPVVGVADIGIANRANNGSDQ